MRLKLRTTVAHLTFPLNSLAIRLVPQRRYFLPLAYHRVGTREELWPESAVFAECSLEQFAAEMAWLSTHCHVLDLAQVHHIIRTGKPWPSRAVMVTFDDGYADDVLRVRPVVERYGIRPVVFLATDYVGTTRRYWWDRVGTCLQLTRAGKLQLPFGQREMLQLGTEEQRNEATTLLSSHARYLSTPARDRFIAELEQALGVADTTHAACPLVLSWEQARELRSSFDFGAHTVTHPVLSALDAQAAYEEMGRSRAVVEEQLGVECASIAIPYGGRADYNEETLRVAAQLGFVTIFTLEQLVRDPLHCEQLTLFDRVALSAGSGLAGLALQLTWPRLFVPTWFAQVRSQLAARRAGISL